VNGVEVFSGTKSRTPQSLNTRDINIAVAQSTGYTGYLSNIRIVKGTAVYISAFTPPTAPLEPIANTSLLTLRTNSFVDEGPNRFAITRNGDTRITPFSPFKTHTIVPDSHSVYFDGNGDYLNLSSSDAFSFGTSDFTIEGWWYLERLSSGASDNNTFLLDFRNNTSAGAVGTLYIDVGASSALRWYANGSVRITGEVPPINSWLHIAVCRSSGTTRLFVNGIQQGSNFGDSINYVAAPLVINRESDGTNNRFVKGYTSNLRIVKGTAVYTSNFTPPTSPLTAIANTSLLTCQSPTVIDTSDNAFAITVTGNAQPTKYNPFGDTITTGVEYSPASHGGSYYFDGSGDSFQVVPAVNSHFVDPFNTGKNTTIECWIYMNSYTSPRTCLYGHWTGSVGWTVDVDTSGNLFITANGAGPTVTLSTKILIKQWQHLALSCNNGTTTIYLNGASVGTLAAQNPGDATTNFVVGMRSDSTIPLNGYISNLVFYQGYTKYTSNFVPPAFVSYDPRAIVILNGTNAAITDGVGKNVLETVGNARVINGVKKYGAGAMYFDGTGDRLIVPSSTDFDFGTGNFTIEMWVNITDVASTWEAIISRAYGVAGGWRLYKNQNNNQLRWYHNTTSIVLTTGSTLANDTWSHIAVVRNSGTLTIYIDGVNRGSAADTNNYNPGVYALEIGEGVVSSAFPYQGYIDDLRITKGVARYTANFTPPAEPFMTQ
jgi:hypothetical protein